LEDLANFDVFGIQNLLLNLFKRKLFIYMSEWGTYFSSWQPGWVGRTPIT